MKYKSFAVYVLGFVLGYCAASFPLDWNGIVSLSVVVALGASVVLIADAVMDGYGIR